MDRRSFAQCNLDLFLNTFIRDKKGGFFCECGAANGIEISSCLFFEKFLGWTGINVEASPSLFTRLQDNRPNSINIHAALSYQDGNVPFYPCWDSSGQETGCGSVSCDTKFIDYLSSVGHRRATDPVMIPTLSFGTLCKKCMVKTIDLFVLDVEGHELEVLKGVAETDNHLWPNMFCIEHGHVGIDALRKTLSLMNYDFLTVDPRDINAIFVKRQQ